MTARRVRERITRGPGSQLWAARERPDYDGPLLLDTHIWIWMLEGDSDRLGRAIVSLLDRAAARTRLAVSDVSFWEVGLKTASRKLVLSRDTAIWLERAERAPGVVYLPLDRPTLVQSTRLGGTLHGDPADRMLIVTAQRREIPLVTADGNIIEYAARVRGVPVCDAR